MRATSQTSHGPASHGFTMDRVPHRHARAACHDAPTTRPPLDTFDRIPMANARQDHALPADYVDSRIATITHLGDPSHYRLDLAESFGSGQVEFCAIDDGFYVVIGDTRYNAPYGMATSAPDMLRICVASRYGCAYWPKDGNAIYLNGPGASITMEPADSPQREGMLFGENHLVHVMIHRDVLDRYCPVDTVDVPAAIGAFLAGRLDHVVMRRLALSPGLLRCLEDLHNCTIEGFARRLFMQGKAIEVLSHAFEALAQDEEGVAASAADASATTRRGVMKAQRMLMESFVAPPTLEALAHQVGLSRSALCVGFRQVIGQTVFDFIADLRMQRALEMLRQQEQSIAQIAHAVGFNHTSSFSAAVQRRFGVTPSELRLRELRID